MFSHEIREHALNPQNKPADVACNIYAAKGTAKMLNLPRQMESGLSEGLEDLFMVISIRDSFHKSNVLRTVVGQGILVTMGVVGEDPVPVLSKLIRFVLESLVHGESHGEDEILVSGRFDRQHDIVHVDRAISDDGFQTEDVSATRLHDVDDFFRNGLQLKNDLKSIITDGLTHALDVVDRDGVHRSQHLLSVSKGTGLPVCVEAGRSGLRKDGHDIARRSLGRNALKSLDLKEGVKSRGLLALDVAGDRSEHPVSTEEALGQDNLALWLLVPLVDKVVVALEKLRCFVVGVNVQAGPNVGGRDDLGLELCDNAKVSRTTLQSLPKILVVSLVGPDDVTIAKHNLKLLDVVACKAADSLEPELAFCTVSHLGSTRLREFYLCLLCGSCTLLRW